MTQLFAWIPTSHFGSVGDSGAADSIVSLRCNFSSTACTVTTTNQSQLTGSQVPVMTSKHSTNSLLLPSQRDRHWDLQWDLPWNSYRW